MQATFAVRLESTITIDFKENRKCNIIPILRQCPVKGLIDKN